MNVHQYTAEESQRYLAAAAACVSPAAHHPQRFHFTTNDMISRNVWNLL
jgi:hypothetical protein